MLIRSARPADAEALLAIYAPYVENTAVSFETVPPTAEEFALRIEKTLRGYPYLALEDEGEIRGYAYAGSFHARASYRWSAEASIYIRQDMHGRGYGRALYRALEEELRDMGVRNLYACIAAARAPGDPYLTDGSPRFHERMGFHLCGTFRQCANKFGRWYDMIWMEKMIGPHEERPAPVRPAGETAEKQG